jgi:protein-S-isoprenylcysteine O-methyltransferase Ste14
MGLYSMVAFMTYIILFVITQQIILRQNRVQPVICRDPPLHYLLFGLSVSTLPWAAIPMIHQQVRLIPILIGGPLILIGYLVSMFAQIELGNNWVGGVGLHKKHKLITSGP